MSAFDGQAEEPRDYIEVDEHPYVIEEADGTEVAEADDPWSAKEAARHLLTEGGYAELVVRARHSGRNEKVTTDEHGAILWQSDDWHSLPALQDDPNYGKRRP